MREWPLSRDVPTHEVTVLFPWNFPLTPLTPLDVQQGHNVLSCDETPPLERQRPEQVWDGGVRGVNDMSSVDIGSLCVLSPPVNILASQIFCKHSVKPRIHSHT